MQILINLYETFSEALHTIQELEGARVVPDDISLITKNGKSSAIDEALDADKATKKKKKKKEKGASAMSETPKVEASAETMEPIDPDLKAVFFDNIHLHDLTGIGAIVGGGWMVKDSIRRTASAEQGLITGAPIGLIESMIDSGLSREHAETYIEGLKRGGTLIGIKIPPELQKVSMRIMREEHRPLDPHMRGHHYWTSQYEYKDDKTVKSNRLLAMLIAGSNR